MSPALNVVLDTHIWDELAADTVARDRVRELCESSALAVIVPATVHHELVAGPFGSVPDWFPTTKLPDTVFVLDHSSLDQAELGEGTTFSAHPVNRPGPGQR